MFSTVTASTRLRTVGLSASILLLSVTLAACSQDNPTPTVVTLGTRTATRASASNTTAVGGATAQVVTPLAGAATPAAGNATARPAPSAIASSTTVTITHIPLDQPAQPAPGAQTPQAGSQPAATGQPAVTGQVPASGQPTVTGQVPTSGQPAAKGQASASSTPSANGQVAATGQTAGTTYVVRSGDTLANIAARTGVSVAELMRMNGITNPNLVQVGQRLALAAGTSAVAQAPGAANPPAAGQATAVPSGPPAVAQAPATATPAPGVSTASVPSGSASTYIVRPGDTLAKIAARYQIAIRKLVAANPQITNPNRIYTGQVVNIPAAS